MLDAEVLYVLSLELHEPGERLPYLTQIIIWGGGED